MHLQSHIWKQGKLFTVGEDKNMSAVRKSALSTLEFDTSFPS